MLERSATKLGKDKHDRIAEDLRLLEGSLSERVQEMGWELEGGGLSSTELDPASPGTKQASAFSNHGKTTIEKIQNFGVPVRDE